MAMPGRNGYAVSGGWANSTMKINGQTFPADISITTRTNNTPPEYTAANSVSFTGEYEDGGTDEYMAYIIDPNNMQSSSPADNSSDANSNVTGSSDEGYRYGFNGKEKDNDMDGNNYDYGMRIYNPQLGRFLSLDPLFKGYPWNSPYSYAENDVIRSVDIDGGEQKIVIEKIYYDDNKKVVDTYRDVQDGNDKYKLGDGTLTIITWVHEPTTDTKTNNTTVYQGTTRTFFDNKTVGKGFFGKIGAWISNLGKKFNVGIVVFGNGRGKDALMGGDINGDTKITQVIDLNDKDTKDVFDMLDIIGKDPDEHIDRDEMTGKIPEIVPKILNAATDKLKEKGIIKGDREEGDEKKDKEKVSNEKRFKDIKVGNIYYTKGLGNFKKLSDSSAECFHDKEKATDTSKGSSSNNNPQ